MRKVFTLFFVLVYCSMNAQDTAPGHVLMFSSSGAGFNSGSTRDVNADTSISKNTSVNISSGITYGKWEGNRLFYYGLSFGYSTNKFNDESYGSWNVGPVVGLMKKIPISGSLYYTPFGEASIGFYKSTHGEENHGGQFRGVLSAVPFAVGIQTSRKVDLILAVGNISADYFTAKIENEVKVSQFSIGAQLNVINFRLLLRI